MNNIEYFFIYIFTISVFHIVAKSIFYRFYKAWKLYPRKKELFIDIWFIIWFIMSVISYISLSPYLNLFSIKEWFILIIKITIWFCFIIFLFTLSYIKYIIYKKFNINWLGYWEVWLNLGYWIILCIFWIVILNILTVQFY